MPKPSPTPPEPCVHIVDDDVAMRQSLSAVMSHASLNARDYACALDFLRAADPATSGCLLLDLRMPDMTGLELLRELRSRRVMIPVVMLTGHGDVPSAVECMKLGVVDFLEKPADPRVIVSSVRRALELGERWSRELGEAAGARDRLNALSLRERQLLAMLAQGKSSKQIAAELGIAEKTVSNHRAHLLTKTGAANTAELVHLHEAASRGSGRGEGWAGIPISDSSD